MVIKVHQRLHQLDGCQTRAESCPTPDLPPAAAAKCTVPTLEPNAALTTPFSKGCTSMVHGHMCHSQCHCLPPCHDKSAAKCQPRSLSAGEGWQGHLTPVSRERQSTLKHSILSTGSIEHARTEGEREGRTGRGGKLPSGSSHGLGLGQDFHGTRADGRR